MKNFGFMRSGGVLKEGEEEWSYSPLKFYLNDFENPQEILNALSSDEFLKSTSLSMLGQIYEILLKTGKKK